MNDNFKQSGPAILSPRAAEALGSLSRKLIRENPEEAREALDALALEERVEVALSFHGRDRFDLITLSSESGELIRALPEPELWITIKEAGDEEGIELIREASPAQLVYITDLEWWHKDALDPLAAAYWFMVLAEAGPETVHRWFLAADEELMVAVFAKFFTVHRPDPNNEGSEPWRALKNMWTADNEYFLHFYEPTLAPTIERVLASIRAEEDVKYYALLDMVENLVAGEQEDAANRFRNARLGDFGFVGFDESFSIYEPMSDREMARIDAESGGERRSRGGAAVGTYSIALADSPPILSRALSLVDSREAAEDIAMGLAALTNRILTADALDLTSLESVKAALLKAHAFVEAGLVRWAGDEPEAAARALERIHVFHLFRAGFSMVSNLAKRANALKKSGWIAKTPLAPELLGEDGRLIEGLTRPRPAYYLGADDKGVPVFGEFRGQADVKRSHAAAHRAEFLGRLFFEALNASADDLAALKAAYAQPALTFETVFLTGAAHGVASGEMKFHPLSFEDARAAIEIMMTQAPPRRVRDDVGPSLLARVEPLLNRLASFCETDPRDTREFIAQCLALLESETSVLEMPSLDRRYISCLVIS